jgi:hypothetical protein
MAEMAVDGKVKRVGVISAHPWAVWRTESRTGRASRARARCVAVKTVSPLRGGEIVEVRHMAVEDACEHDMLVQIHWQGREVAIPLSQLDCIGADESTQEAIGDCHY